MIWAIISAGKSGFEVMICVSRRAENGFLLGWEGGPVIVTLFRADILAEDCEHLAGLELLCASRIWETTRKGSKRGTEM